MSKETSSGACYVSYSHELRGGLTVLREKSIEAHAVDQWQAGSISALNLTGETEGNLEVATIKNANGDVIYANGSGGWQIRKSD